MIHQLLFWKHKKVLLSLCSFILAFSSFGFTDKECLEARFKASISHKGQPFGLTQNEIIIDKNQCIISINVERLKYMKNHWLVDICREPIHIKEGASGSVNVIKRVGSCGTSSEDTYCSNLKKIETYLQDFGLIFAKGEKEDLKSNHGKVFCSYKLIKEYLRKGKVLSRLTSFQDKKVKEIPMKIEIGPSIKVDAPVPATEKKAIEKKEPGDEIEF